MNASCSFNFGRKSSIEVFILSVIAVRLLHTPSEDLYRWIRQSVQTTCCSPVVVCFLQPHQCLLFSRWMLPGSSLRLHFCLGFSVHAKNHLFLSLSPLHSTMYTQLQLSINPSSLAARHRLEHEGEQCERGRRAMVQKKVAYVYISRSDWKLLKAWNEGTWWVGEWVGGIRKRMYWSGSLCSLSRESIWCSSPAWVVIARSDEHKRKDIMFEDRWYFACCMHTTMGPRGAIQIVKALLLPSQSV